jgi:acetyl-CoA acetyltransferase
MGIGPTYAIPKVLERTGLSSSDVDLWEINEAFASMYVYCLEKLQLDPAKVNVNGGAIAFGHPLGATGARQVATGLNELRRRKGKVLVTSMCIGLGCVTTLSSAAVHRDLPADIAVCLCSAWAPLPSSLASRLRSRSPSKVAR